MAKKKVKKGKGKTSGKSKKTKAVQTVSQPTVVTNNTKKAKLLKIYISIFMAALVLYIFSILRYIYKQQEYQVFSLSLIIMFLSLWGYAVVKKYY